MAKVFVEFAEKFKDGNIIPQSFKAGEVAEIEYDLIERIKRSGGIVKIVGIPQPEEQPKAEEKPQKAKKDGK
jgi:hypothetical protein